MRPDVRHGESGLNLATRPLLPQHDGTALILPDDVERVLADIDADYGGRGVEFLSHGVLLVCGYVPSDFDTSPYLMVVKPTLARGFNFKDMHWADLPQVHTTGHARAQRL
jgi:hypothetical protein